MKSVWVLSKGDDVEGAIVTKVYTDKPNVDALCDDAPHFDCKELYLEGYTRTQGGDCAILEEHKLFSGD